MKMVKERARTMSAVNDERRQVLPSKVIWDGTIDRFEVFRNNVEGHHGQIGVGYLFDSNFQEAYLERGVDCYADFLDEVPSASQIKKDARALYGALLSAYQSGVRCRILMENRDKQDGIRSWCQLVQQYETDGNRNVRIKRLESVIDTVFHRNYRGGLVKWIQHYEDAFKELPFLCTIVFPWYMGKYKYKCLPMGIKISWFLIFFKISCLSLSKIWNMLRLLSYLDDLLILTNSLLS
jgi:hypothetical protein